MTNLTHHNLIIENICPVIMLYSLTFFSQTEHITIDSVIKYSNIGISFANVNTFSLNL